MSFSEQYATAVLSGEIVVGKFVRLACERFMRDLKNPDFYFDPAEGSVCINFNEQYTNLWEDKWRGQPVKYELWQKFILEQVYGWFRRSDGLRRVRKVFVEVAKKNAKSTLVGGVALFHLFADERVKTPKVFVGANNEEQAKIAVNIAGRIIQQSPELMRYVEDKEVMMFNYKENIVNIVHKGRDGFIKALPKEASNTTSLTAGGKHGFNPSLGIIDEYAMADTDALLNTLESAQAAREEPLIFVITTAGFKQNGPCFQQLRRTGIEILEGNMQDDSYLAFIYEPDEKDNIADPDTWPKCNPNIGVSVFPEFLKSRLSAAKNEGGSKEVDVKTLNFNTWCEAAEVWIPSDKWAKNTHGISVLDLAGAECWTGYDFAARVDICAVAALFYNFKEINGKMIHPILWWFWMPEERVKNNKEKFDFQPWVDQGYIRTVPGNTMEWEYIIDTMREELQKYYHVSGAYDPYLATNGAVQGLVREGLQLNPISQGFQSISEPTKEWELLLTNEQIEHFNNPVAAYMNKNCSIIRDNNRNIKIQKIDGEKGALKIDAIAAAINALAQAMTPGEQGEQMISSW